MLPIAPVSTPRLGELGQLVHGSIAGCWPSRDLDSRVCVLEHEIILPFFFFNLNSFEDVPCSD